MTQIEYAGDIVHVDAEVLAKAFRISADDLQRGMRDGIITSRFERGEGEDAGKVRLTFFSDRRRVRMTADLHGNVLTCSAADLKRSASRSAPPDRSDRAHLDALLDEGLQGTFPASDPVAVSFDPRNGDDKSRTSDD